MRFYGFYLLCVMFLQSTTYIGRYLCTLLWHTYLVRFLEKTIIALPHIITTIEERKKEKKR